MAQDSQEKTIFGLRKHVQVLVQGGAGAPFAFQLNLHSASSYLIATFVFLLVTFCGSLLFFRELEINRKLQSRVLEFETQQSLGQTTPFAPALASKEAPTTATASADGTQSQLFNARISELAADCQEGDCNVRLSMMTRSPGAAEGQLLIVLETEVPRIGARTPGSEVRKRFFLYPGDSSVDALANDQLAQLSQKAFRFSRALKTTTSFRIGKLLRPLAVNAYVFDSNKTLLQHERKAIDIER